MTVRLRKEVAEPPKHHEGANSASQPLEQTAGTSFNPIDVPQRGSLKTKIFLNYDIWANNKFNLGYCKVKMESKTKKIMDLKALNNAQGFFTGS